VPQIVENVDYLASVDRCPQIFFHTDNS